MAEYVHEVSADEQAKIASFVRWFAIGTVAFILGVILLFFTADSWLRLISIESERQFIEPYIELALENDFIDGDPVLQDYISELTLSIYDELEHEWDDSFELRVYVIESEQINAFATLGGHIFVFDGLMKALDDENSLAMVLAHEVAHVHNRDPLLGAGRGLLIQMAIAALSGNSIDPSAINVGSEVVLTSYSREQESAADELALELLHKRYGHVGGATTLFEMIDVDLDDEELEEFFEFLSTHPDTDDRIERLHALAEERGWTERDPVPYPDDVKSVLED